MPLSGDDGKTGAWFLRWETLKWGVLLVVGVLALSRRKLSPQLPQDATSPGPPGDPLGDGSTIYNPMILDDEQRQAADLIVQKATIAGLDPAFMLALAVTESSLRPAVIGDDGVSVGLFQINTRFHPDYSLADLQDASVNADLAMNMMNALIAEYPGNTYADYAEAWTLGGAGRFAQAKRNPRKTVALARAVSDLKLALDIKGVPNA